MHVGIVVVVRYCVCFALRRTTNKAGICPSLRWAKDEIDNPARRNRWWLVRWGRWTADWDWLTVNASLKDPFDLAGERYVVHLTLATARLENPVEVDSHVHNLGKLVVGDSAWIGLLVHPA